MRFQIQQQTRCSFQQWHDHSNTFCLSSIHSFLRYVSSQKLQMRLNEKQDRVNIILVKKFFQMKRFGKGLVHF